MIRSGNRRAIEIEVWQLGVAALGTLVASVPPPLAVENVKLASGEWIKGFLCEEVALRDALEITSREAGALTWLPSSPSSLSG
jgi:allophanate hydrolase